MQVQIDAEHAFPFNLYNYGAEGIGQAMHADAPFQPKISFLSNTSNFASKETGNLFEELRPLCEKSEIARSENSISFIANAELKVFSEEKG